MEAFYEGLAEILEVDVGVIDPDLDMTRHGWNSLAIVSTLALIDECFDQIVNGQKLAECKRVRDIEALIEGIKV